MECGVTTVVAELHIHKEQTTTYSNFKRSGEPDKLFASCIACREDRKAILDIGNQKTKHGSDHYSSFLKANSSVFILNLGGEKCHKHRQKLRGGTAE